MKKKTFDAVEIKFWRRIAEARRSKRGTPRNTRKGA
jgi:hypothetical protein